VAEKTLRVGIKVAQMTGLYDDAKEAWLEADRLGFDTGWLHDHLLNQNDLSAPEEEGWSILATLLALSKNIRGGLLVTSNTFRHPSLLAKIATTIDRISGGRVEVGLGAGWMEAEHEQYGITLPPLRDRVRALDEACQILISLWTQERTTFNGEYYTLKEAYHEPKAIQKPHPPLVIGAKGEKVTLRTTAKYAAEWNYSGGTPEEFAHKSAVLDEHCRAIGRDPELIDLSEQYIEKGATHLIYTCPQPYSAEGARWLWNEVVLPLRG
jgi:F420-dependent oxidoreductase-like protein